MIRVSEAVLPGHPDKLCDFVAESIVDAALALDAEAYAQIEAGIWCDQLWLSGGYAVRGTAMLDVERIAVAAVHSIAQAVDRKRPLPAWNVRNCVCRYDVDPTLWTRHVNDQAIVIGWAGYDAKVHYLPPEHCLALEFRDALWEACCSGALQRCGPDGKLIVRLREDAQGWDLEHVLVTLEHPEAISVFELAGRLQAVLASRYEALQRRDARWRARWRDVDLLVNPNGPLSDAGSRKDNGQTGRKLVMDYYGPRVPLGGGALWGKDPRHVDRFGARVARELAVAAVQRGAYTCTVRAVYAPNVAAPLDVAVETEGGGEPQIDVSRFTLGDTSLHAPEQSERCTAAAASLHLRRHYPEPHALTRSSRASPRRGYGISLPRSQAPSPLPGAAPQARAPRRRTRSA
jgi:S-adenosylmethionine synthetase